MISRFICKIDLRINFENSCNLIFLEKVYSLFSTRTKYNKDCIFHFQHHKFPSMVVNDAIYDRNLITNTDFDFYSSRYRINSFGHKNLCSEIVNTISQIDAKSSRSCN